MGKSQISVVVLQNRVKFWCMIPMGLKYNRLRKKLNGGGWERDSQVADLIF